MSFKITNGTSRDHSGALTVLGPRPPPQSAFGPRRDTVVLHAAQSRAINPAIRKNTLPMTNTTPTAPQGGDNLRSEVSGIGSSKGDDYAIAPEDQHIADAVLKMDPYRDTPHTHRIPEGRTLPPLRLTALPPDLQGKAHEALARIPEDQRAANEHRVVSEIVRKDMLPSIRIKTGLGENATPYHREGLEVARRVSDLYEEFDRNQKDIEAVARYEVRVDPNTGERKPHPVMSLQGTRLKARVERQEDINRQIRLLVNDDGTPGPEGRKLMRKALHETVTAIKTRNAQVEEDAEARRRADTTSREKRINAKAEQYASFFHNGG